MCASLKEMGKWVPGEMGVFSYRRKPCHLCVSEGRQMTGSPGHKGKTEGRAKCFCLVAVVGEHA